MAVSPSGSHASRHSQVLRAFLQVKKEGANLTSCGKVLQRASVVEEKALLLNLTSQNSMIDGNKLLLPAQVGQTNPIGERQFRRYLVNINIYISKLYGHPSHIKWLWAAYNKDIKPFLLRIKVIFSFLVWDHWTNQRNKYLIMELFLQNSKLLFKEAEK